MEIEIISCAGASEKNDIDSLIKLARPYPKIELGIQVSGSKCSRGAARYDWLKELAETLKFEEEYRAAALHINEDWCQDFCVGTLSHELKEFLSARRKDGRPVFQRLQLNFLSGREYVYADTLADMIASLPENTIALSYNDANSEVIHEVHSRGVPFHNLYDSSFGLGINPGKREGIVFSDRLQGYAGGLNPENIAFELDKIYQEVGDAIVYVDAESGLKGPDGAFSPKRAEAFIKNILSWEAKHA